MTVLDERKAAESAIDNLRTQLRALKREFDAIHAEGLAAIERRDFRSASDAVRRERHVAEEYQLVMRQLWEAVEALWRFETRSRKDHS